MVSEPVNQSSLLIEGIRCGACVSRIEEHLRSMRGVKSARVHLPSQRVQVEWSPSQLDSGALINRLAEIGYTARPDRAGEASALERRENRAALIRLGVAGLGGMTVMTYAVSLYAGSFSGMAPPYRALFQWLSLLVTLPVVVIAARPFFVGAVRDLRVGRPGMDVPVALAIGGAFVASGWATFQGKGQVYFDSVCMFTFFLSVGRYLEMRARHRSASLSRRLTQAAPIVARRLEGGTEQLVPVESLMVGDHLVVRPGETLAADGRVLEGRSGVAEALLTGEPWPRTVGPGDEVIGGSQNTASPLLIETTRVGPDTTLASIVALMERAQSEKPAIAQAADRVAVVFVTAVLVIALGTAVFWSFHAPDQAIWTTLAVLIATCPCALSLATPAALAAATHGLAEAGLLITRGHVLEGLASADRVVFDKTGTLTLGEPTLIEVVLLRSGLDRAACIRRAQRLESHSEHPLARALMEAECEDSAPLDPLSPSQLESVPGFGIEAFEGDERTRIGHPDWVHALAPQTRVDAAPGGEARVWILLGDAAGAIAWLGFADPIRGEADQALHKLRASGLSLEMLSGDPSPAAAAVSKQLDLEVAWPAATPDEKVERVRALQEAGERVIVVGDGVNDGPVMGAAGVSLAMGSGSDLTRVGSDAILMRDSLALLPRAIIWARRTRRVIRQNLCWAIGYNLIALPLALTGHLAPWLAAAGMSTSSLVVVFNAMRLQRDPESLR